MTRRRVIGGGILSMGLLAAFGASAVGTNRPTGSDTEPSSSAGLVSVEVAPVNRTRSYEVERSYSGTIAAKRTSDLGFERSAKIVTMWVEEGDAVRKGDKLAELDSRQLVIQTKRIEAQRAEAAARLAELRKGPREETIEAARADVLDRKAQVELQRRNYQRTRDLLDQNAASIERLDTTELGLESAEARLRVAQKVLDELEAGTRVEKIDAQAAAVDQLDAQLADLAVEIEDSTLVAPFDGQISRRYIDEGTVTSPAAGVLQIVETGALEARIGLPVDSFDQLSHNQSFEVLVGNRSWAATYNRAVPEVDLTTRTRIAIFDLDPSASPHVVPGQIVRAQLTQTQSTDGFWVPTTSLVRSYRGLWATYVVEQDSDEGDAQVRRRDVELLHTEGNRSLVRGTLTSGDQVITSGTHRVVPGQRVNPQQKSSLVSTESAAAL